MTSKEIFPFIVLFFFMLNIYIYMWVKEREGGERERVLYLRRNHSCSLVSIDPLHFLATRHIGNEVMSLVCHDDYQWIYFQCGYWKQPFSHNYLRAKMLLYQNASTTILTQDVSHTRLLIIILMKVRMVNDKLRLVIRFSIGVANLKKKSVYNRNFDPKIFILVAHTHAHTRAYIHIYLLK